MIFPTVPVKNAPSSAPAQPGWLLWALGALACSAFLARIRFVPTIPNNIGPFEVAVVIIVAGVGWTYWRQHRLPASNVVLIGWALLIPLAGLSLLWVPGDNLLYGIVQFGVLSFGVLLVGACYTLLVSEPRYLTWFLHVFALSAGIYCI